MSQAGLHDPTSIPALCHLILDTAAGLGDQCRSVAAASPPLRARAASALLTAVQPDSQPRLAPKLAAVFGLAADDFDADQQRQLLDGISALLDANATSATGAALLLHFSPLRRFFHLEALLEDLILSRWMLSFLSGSGG
jgi:hypothetical protein